MRIQKQGSPHDRGRQDAYYGRLRRPHKWLDGFGDREVFLTDQTEIAEYHRGYDEIADQDGDE